MIFDYPRQHPTPQDGCQQSEPPPNPGRFTLDAFAIDLIEVAEPQLRDGDLLVEIRAIGLNPGEATIRSIRSAEPDGWVILGWEFAGVVAETGPAVTGFAVGDRVMGTGDMTRDGCWAQRLAVDHRVVAAIPDELSFTEAASLPIGSLTAWEAMFGDQQVLPDRVDTILIVGGAGGVGSMAIQLLKARASGAFVIGTASRPASRQWCQQMGADLVIDHTADVIEQLHQAGTEAVDMVLSTAGTADNLPWIATVLRPFGHLSATDLGGRLDLDPLVQKSISLHAEMVFAEMMAGADPSRQQVILQTIGEHVAAGEVRPIDTTRLRGLSVDSMRTAHDLLETRRTVGKTVIEL